MIANTPKPPYYAVIFTSTHTDDVEDYSEMGKRMVALAEHEEGFLGIESARDTLGITVSYWRDLESIRRWKVNSEHLFAQKKGREDWYQTYKTRIAFVERDYGFDKDMQS